MNLFWAKYTLPKEPEPNFDNILYFLEGKYSLISLMKSLFEIDIYDSSSDKNDPPPEELYPLEFLLSFNEHNDILNSSSNSLFLCSLKLNESKVDLRPSFLLYF